MQVGQDLWREGGKGSARQRPRVPPSTSLLPSLPPSLTTAGRQQRPILRRLRHPGRRHAVAHGGRDGDPVARGRGGGRGHPGCPGGASPGGSGKGGGEQERGGAQEGGRHDVCVCVCVDQGCAGVWAERAREQPRSTLLRFWRESGASRGTLPLSPPSRPPPPLPTPLHMALANWADWALHRIPAAGADAFAAGSPLQLLQTREGVYVAAAAVAVATPVVRVALTRLVFDVSGREERRGLGGRHANRKTKENRPHAKRPALPSPNRRLLLSPHTSPSAGPPSPPWSSRQAPPSPRASATSWSSGMVRERRRVLLFVC